MEKKIQEMLKKNLWLQKKSESRKKVQNQKIKKRFGNYLNILKIQKKITIFFSENFGKKISETCQIGKIQNSKKKLFEKLRINFWKFEVVEKKIIYFFFNFCQIPETLKISKKKYFFHEKVETRFRFSFCFPTKVILLPPPFFNLSNLSSWSLGVTLTLPSRDPSLAVGASPFSLSQHLAAIDFCGEHGLNGGFPGALSSSGELGLATKMIPDWNTASGPKITCF